MKYSCYLLIFRELNAYKDFITTEFGKTSQNAIFENRILELAESLKKIKKNGRI